MPSHESRPTFFATTRWTLVCDAARGGVTRAVDALGALLGTYWQPLYRYARRKDKSKEDAEDLVQGFFTHLIEARALRDTDRARGRFRAFMLPLSALKARRRSGLSWSPVTPIRFRMLRGKSLSLVRRDPSLRSWAAVNRSLVTSFPAPGRDWLPC